MITKDYLIDLFSYNLTVNRQLCGTLIKQQIKDEYALKVFSHLLTAEKIWLKRIKGEDVSKEIFWPGLSVKESSDLIESNAERYGKFLGELREEDLDREINYRNSRGEEFNTPLRDILMHLIIHGGYHRGQVASAMRWSGGEPVNTDYIYVRSKL